MAILLAAFTPSIQLLGISTVYGNQTVEKTTENALKTLAISGIKDIPVVKGAERPLLRPSRQCPEIHGESGLETHSEPFPSVAVDVPVQGKAVNVIYQYLSNQEDKVTLIATGCLTNVALLLRIYPEVLNNLKRLVVLGGSYGQGNTGPVTEWNMELDPEAAKVVFDAGMYIELVQIPIQVTHTCLVSPSIFSFLEVSCTSSSALPEVVL